MSKPTHTTASGEPVEPIERGYSFVGTEKADRVYQAQGIAERFERWGGVPQNVRDAVSAFDRAEQSVPGRGSTVEAAEKQAREQLVKAIKNGTKQLPDISRPLGDAYLAEQVQRSAELTYDGVLSDLGQELNGAVRSSWQQLHEQLREPVMTALGKISEAASTLPSNMDDAKALRAEPKVREAWLGVDEHAKTVADALSLRADLVSLARKDAQLDKRGDFVLTSDDLDLENREAIVRGSGVYAGTIERRSVSRVLPSSWKPYLLTLARAGVTWAWNTPSEADEAFEAYRDRYQEQKQPTQAKQASTEKAHARRRAQGAKAVAAQNHGR